MKRSLTIMMTSDESWSLQLLPNVLSEPDATAWPLPRHVALRGVTRSRPCVYQPAMQPPPSGWGRKGARFAVVRVVQDRGLVDRAVDGAALQPHDERHGDAVYRGRHAHIGRQGRVRLRQHCELAAGLEVDVVHA